MSRRRTWLGAVTIALSGAAGCGHAHTVEPGSSSPADKQAAADHATPPVDRQASPAHRPAPAPGAGGDHLSPPKDEIQLATAPAELLKPGAIDNVQRRLISAGTLPAGQASGKLDSTTQQAVARFQREHKLPATGSLDNTTVKHLGLNPNDVFKSSHD